MFFKFVITFATPKAGCCKIKVPVVVLYDINLNLRFCITFIASYVACSLTVLGVVILNAKLSFMSLKNRIPTLVALLLAAAYSFAIGDVAGVVLVAVAVALPLTVTATDVAL